MRPTLFHKKGYWYFCCPACSLIGLPHYTAAGAHTELESHLRQTHEMARS